MKKLIGAAVAAGAALAGASAANAGEISANINLTTDYVFRGVSLSGNDPAIQGGFDWASDSELLYAGVWGSSLSSGMEMDVFAGITPDLGTTNTTQCVSTTGSNLCKEAFVATLKFDTTLSALK